MSTSSSFEERFGSHRMRFEAPDQICTVLGGRLSVEEAEAIIGRIYEIGRRHGPLLSMLDVTRYETSGDRVRQVFLRGTTERIPVRAGAIYGASFPIRIAMSMVLTAGAHILPSRFSFPVTFTPTEAEARAWLDAHRPADSVRPADLLPTGT
ncbi:STAS/SEC14 domain-containing protein [Polyangium sp. y55x31]|uniref:STAS/SEC14 domain-containing protein n=1 Tax=Polyangium sp. y55x31 TaxID=3042688 RepID=UPI0024827D36|nr:STAS/SEC14 domain-containing protein [Polyangium sp. y55x31]MDI1480790.1 STAS/SEC14 domain-containing protein [Polyangium sp. y55x31]